MEFRMLGPLEVADGDRLVTIGGRRQRVVLACLLQRPNVVVPVATVIDEVWGDNPPASARNAVQTYIARLRKALGDDRIQTVGGGYRLRVEPDEIDAQRFEGELRRADGLAPDPAAAAHVLTEALALWRGPALADLREEPAVAGEIGRLDELRKRAVERRIDADLACGRHASIVGELEMLISQDPRHERLRGQLMTALYRSGRQADALAAYRQAEHDLGEQFGIDPSPELRALHGQIVRQDPGLEAPGPPDEPTATSRSLFEPYSRPRSRRWPGSVATVVAVLAAVAVAASVVAIRAVAGGHDSVGSIRPGMAILDAGTGAQTAFVPPEVVAVPVEALFADGAFWVLNIEPLEFVRIDPASGEVLTRIASPIDDVGYFTVDGNDLWITDWTQPVLSKVDIGRRREVARYEDLPGAGGSGGVVVADGSVWVARRDADGGLGMVARLDPVTGEPEHLFHSLPGSLALAYGDDGAIWTTGSFGDINRIDPGANTVTSTRVEGRTFYVAAGGGYGWVADEAAGVVHQVDSGGRIVEVHPTGFGARTLSFSGGQVWVGNQDDGSVSAIDLATGSTETYEIGHPLQAVAAGAGRVLVQVLAGDTFDELVEQAGGLGGNGVRLLTGGYDYDPPDSALVQSPFGRQVTDATCAGLLRRGDGGQIQPDVAAALPTVSDDGLTYSFVVGDGYRFSPPDNSAVTAETFRATIERSLSPDLGPSAPGRDLLADVAGASDYISGAAEHIAGLEVAGKNLTITLAAPSDDFLDRLTSTIFCAVPDGTPALAGFGGLGLPVAEGTPGELVLPAAGPYYIARFVHGDYAILRRNPNYHGPRPHRFEVIAIRGGIAPALAADLVARGEWDGLTNLMSNDGSPRERFSDRVGCVTPLTDGAGADLAALCLR